MLRKKLVDKIKTLVYVQYLYFPQKIMLFKGV